MKIASVFFLLFFTFSSTVAGPLPNKENDVFLSNELSEGEDVTSRIAKVNEESDVDLYQGDIKLLKGDMNSGDPTTKRNAQQSRKVLWKGRMVPYVISPALVNLWYGPTIRKAIEEFHKRTCLTFVPRTTESNWIEFVEENGCWSSVGRTYWQAGGQRLSLGRGCNITATVMHELLHAIGFWHEQSRPDRNNFVEILWENIEEGKEFNFFKYDHFTIDNQEKPYDFESIMHYGNTYFSKNGMDTIRAITQPSLKLGQRDGFSSIDIDEINKLYDCNGQSSGWSSWSSFTPCDSQCNKKRERFCVSSNPSVDCLDQNSHGVQEETAVCGIAECNAPVDGHWGRWSSWGTCSTPCGPGTRTRTRLCDDPAPAHNGSACTGNEQEEGSCVLQSCGLGPADCEFEVNDKWLCSWTQDNTDDMDWRRGDGPTPSTQTGPVGDHTSGSGHYLYVEASSPALSGQTARLISETFSGSNSSVCLILSYNMYGSGMGSLNIYLNNLEGRNLLISKVGDHGNKWNDLRIDVQSASSYQISIEAVRGSSFRSDIAIDDVAFISEPCSGIPMRNLGCYEDKTRPLNTHYKNVRSQIDWYDMRKTVIQCAKDAKEKGYKVFGVEFYGECWSSDQAKQVYNKDGISNNCWNGVGRDYAFQAYEIM